MWEHTHKYVQNAFQDTPGKHRNWVCPPFENHFPRVFPCFFHSYVNVNVYPRLKSTILGIETNAHINADIHQPRTHTHAYIYIYTPHTHIHLSIYPSIHPSKYIYIYIYMYVYSQYIHIYKYIYMPYMPRYAKHPSHGTCWLSPLWPCWAAAAAAAPRSPAPGLQRTGSPAASAARWPRRRPPGRTGDLGDAGVDLMGCQEISPTKLGILWGFKRFHPL